MVAQAALPPALTSAHVLSGLPPKLRAELLEAFNEIVRNYREGRWEPAELNGGKLSEVVYSIVRGLIDGGFPPSASKRSYAKPRLWPTKTMPPRTKSFPLRRRNSPQVKFRLRAPQPPRAAKRQR